MAGAGVIADDAGSTGNVIEANFVAAVGGDGVFRLHYSVRSKIAKQRRKHNATLHSCLALRSTDPGANRACKQAARRRSRILGLDCICALDMAWGASGRCSVVRFSDC